MLRVLTLSTLFPDVNRPTFGVFVERQTLGLAALDDVAVEIVSPVGIPPVPLRFHPHFRKSRSLPVAEMWKGLRVHRPRFTHLPGPGMRFVPAMIARALLPRLRALRETFPFDVIDAEYFWPDGPAAASLGAALGVPVSIKARGSDIHLWGRTGFGRRQILNAGAGSDGMLAVSAALKRDMAALGLREDRISVHYTGVDLDRFVAADRAAAKRALGIDGPLILLVGHIIERKGQSLAVEALRALPGATLMLVGDGPDRLAIEAQAARLGLTDRVRLTGAQPHEALPGLYAAADISVLPSASEGLANAWVESLACGTPLVISDVGGARELVTNVAAGRIVARTPAAIAEAVRELLAAPPDRSETRKAAEPFTWHANAQALRTHLSALVERHQRGDDPAILAT